jgi:hypothetical protein
MIIKRLIRPERLRQVPPSFSWVDHRLVSGHFIERCDPPALALYLFLVTVADVQGLSYYSDASILRRLRLDAVTLAAARRQLQAAELIAYAKPLYQVLDLAEATVCSATAAPASPRAAATQSVADILRRIVEGGGAA